MFENEEAEMTDLRRNSLVWLAAGVLLFVLAGVQMVGATRRQEAEQQRRDAHWLEVNAAAARSNPKVLPGEEKPGPAPLEGWGWIALLATAATGCVGWGGVLWLQRLLNPPQRLANEVMADLSGPARSRLPVADPTRPGARAEPVRPSALPRSVGHAAGLPPVASPGSFPHLSPSPTAGSPTGPSTGPATGPTSGAGAAAGLPPGVPPGWRDPRSPRSER